MSLTQRFSFAYSVEEFEACFLGNLGYLKQFFAQAMFSSEIMFPKEE